MVEVEEKIFTRVDGTERRFTEIVEENIDRVSKSYYTGVTTVNDFSNGSMNLFELVNQSDCQYDIEFYMETIKQELLFKYATGDALDDFGAQKGIYREEANFSTSNVLLTLANSLNTPITIFEGTEISTDDTIIFLLAEDVKFEVGQTTANAEIICEEAGSIGTVKAGRSNIILTDLPYDLTVTNLNDITDGVDEEEDDSYRDRIIDSHLNYPVGTVKWYEKVAETLVSNAYYHKLSPTNGEIVYKPTSNVTNTDLANLFNQKENDIVNLTINFSPANPKSVIDNGMSIIVHVRSGYSFNVIKTQIINVVSNYVDNLKLGEVFKPSCVGYLCESVEGIQFTQLTGYEEIDLENDEYAVIEGDLQVIQG